MKDNVRSIVKELVQRNAEHTIDIAITEEFYIFLLDEADKRFTTIEEQRAFVIGGACAVGFYGREIKRGMQE